MSDEQDDLDLLNAPEEDERANKEACEEALRRFFAEGFQPGALLEHAWLQDALGVPAPLTANSIEGFRKWQFTLMERIVAFQKALLISHKIALANVYGRGYRIVLSNEQSGWAVNESTREIRRALSKAVARATHVNLDALSVTERQAQASDLNRLRSLREVLRRDEAASKAKAKRSAMVGDVQ